VTSSDVSRAAAELDAQLAAWRERPLGRCPYLVLDARYEKVRHGGAVVECAVLVAMGVREEDGKRTLLGVSVSLSEAEVHWRTFLEGLEKRGLEVTRLITSDDHAGLRAARRAVFPNVPWQRCQFHLQQNAQAYVPQVALRPQVARDLRSVFDASDGAEAKERIAKLVEKYRRPAPKFAEWIEANLHEGLAVFGLPEAHRRRLRTVNALERLNAELHRRTRVATLFPNEASLLRLVSAMAAEISEMGDRTDLPDPGERVIRCLNGSYRRGVAQSRSCRLRTSRPCRPPERLSERSRVSANYETRTGSCRPQSSQGRSPVRSGRARRGGQVLILLDIEEGDLASDERTAGAVRLACSSSSSARIASS